MGKGWKSKYSCGIADLPGTQGFFVCAGLLDLGKEFIINNGVGILFTVLVKSS